MSPDALARIEGEFERLEGERTAVGSLIEALTDREPSPVELRAVAATIHSVYTGIENTLKTILKEVDGQVPSTSSWHAELLQKAATSSDARPEIIGQDLHEQLREYMGFRHVFRNVYGHQLDWEEMRESALRTFEVGDQFVAAVRHFLSRVDQLGAP